MSPFRSDQFPRPAGRRGARVGARVRRAPSRGALLAAVALLCGCAQPAPTRFHTLLPDWQAGAAATRAAAPGWSFGDLRVPVQVDRPQLVLLTGDGTLAVVERERWLAPLGDELRAALEQDLQRALGPADAGPPAERWEIDVEVRRFESALGAEARLEAQWTLARGGAAGEGPCAGCVSRSRRRVTCRRSPPRTARPWRGWPTPSPPACGRGQAAARPARGARRAPEGARGAAGAIRRGAGGQGGATAPQADRRGPASAASGACGAPISRGPPACPRG
jgi:uncharacterized lipoprotein YmbA